MNSITNIYKKKPSLLLFASQTGTKMFSGNLLISENVTGL